MTRVLGTPIEVAHDDDRTRTLLVSDLHVPEGESQVLRDFAELLAQARHDPHHTRVLILGDLLEVYVGSRQLGHGTVRHVVELLGAATRAGVSITVLHGNRDFLLDPPFARATGCRVVPGGLHFCLQGRRVLALHGDELCWRDLPYQRSKRLLRHPLTQALTRALPLALSLWLAGGIRARSMASVQSGDPGRFDPVAPALEAAFASGAEVLVFGHIHRPARGEFRPGAAYLILPAFDAGGVHAEAEGGRLRYRDLAGRTVPDFPPRAFPPA